MIWAAALQAPTTHKNKKDTTIVIKYFSGYPLFLASFCAFLLAFALPAPAEAAADSASSPPAQFVQSLGNTALMSLTGKNMDRKTREDRVRKILHDNFDTAAIGKFALGTYWREASDNQRKEYMSLFEDMVVQTYTTRFEDYSGQKLKVAGSEPSGPADYIVSSQVIQKDGPPVNLQWRVRKEDSGLRVVDVVVEGVSMSVTQRSDFSSVIQNGGGSIDALLSHLRDRKDEAAHKKG
jgi:phospholipid transport system substrate-binding protein